MKVVATINFKGGVGKTTVTWLLGRHIAETTKQKVLVIDADAQMSLTLALGLDEGAGTFVPKFGPWYENQHRGRQKTLFDALDRYDSFARGTVPHFNFPIDGSLVYSVTPSLFFIPSVTDFYWMELEVFSPEHVKGFVKALLGKLAHSPFQPDVVFFDCPPSFTALSYSILSNCSLILIPTNPDVFAAAGLRIMLDGLKGRVQPWPDPELAVFMNKADMRSGRLTRESQFFLDEVTQAAATYKAEGVRITALQQFVPLRAAIRKSVSFGGFPEEFRPYVDLVWQGIKSLG